MSTENAAQARFMVSAVHLALLKGCRARLGFASIVIGLAVGAVFADSEGPGRPRLGDEA